MRTDLGRRDFLKQGASAGLVLGFPFWPATADEPAKPAAPRPDFLALARERMRQENKPGIILIIPDEVHEAAALGDKLSILIGLTDAARKLHAQPVRFKGGAPPTAADGVKTAQRLFCQAVFVCLRRDEVKRIYPELGRISAAVLLDLDGKPIAQLAGADDLFGEGFAAKMGAFLHGDKGERLAEMVKVQRTVLGADACRRFDKAVKDVDSDDFETREAGSRALAEIGPKAPFLVVTAARSAPGPEARYRIEAVFDKIYAAAPQEQPGSRLPFGTQWEKIKFDPCLGCGLAAMPDVTRMYIRCITGKPQ
jgi:hypothetical protein